MPENDVAMTESRKRELILWFEHSVNLVKAVAWPTIVLLTLLIWRGPLTETIQQLPSIVSKSKKITLAGVVLEVGQGVDVTPHIHAALANISPKSLTILVETPTGGINLWEDQYQTEKSYYSELVARKLITIKKNVTSDEIGDYMIDMTDLGIESRSFTLKVVIDQLTSGSETAQQNRTTDAGKSRR